MVPASPEPAPRSAPGYPFPDDLLPTLLAVSLTAVNLLRPVYGPDGTGIVDFTLDYLNPAAQRMAGLPEQPGTTALTSFPDMATTGVFDFYRHVFTTGEAGRYDVNYQADGLDNYFCLAAQRHSDLLVVSFTDTGDQPRTPVEEALRASQGREQAARAEAEAQRQRLHTMLLELPAQVATYRGPDHVYDFVNPRYQRYFSTRTLVGRPIREVIPEADEQGIFAAMDRVYRTGEPFSEQEVELWLDFTGTGRHEQIFVNLQFQPLRDARGCIDGLLDFSYDVTEQVLARRQAEQLNQALETRVAERTEQLQAALRKTERQREAFHQILEQTPAAICILRGAEHRYEYVNPAYQYFFPSRPLLDRTVAEVVPEAVEQGFVALLDGVYRTGETFFGHESPLTIAPASGLPAQAVYFNFAYSAYRENGEIVGISIFAYEVTEQVAAHQQVEDLNLELHTRNEELAATNQQLVRTNVDLDNFIYTASHDLKAPISNIEGLLRTLQGELPAQSQAGEVPHILGLMQDSVNRFVRTIGHLTDVSKLQKEHDQPTSQVPLAAVIEDVRLDLAPLLEQTGGHLRVAVQDAPAVTFSEKNLRSVVYNLLSNALKYRHPARLPEVHVRGRAEADCYVLEVQDNGLGLDLTRERDLFAMFRRLHTHVEGSGLGLYMIKRMVENAGGRIEVQSQLGEGSTFAVYFKR